MTFANPSFLYALPAVLLPVIIHLLKLYRSTTLYYTRVQEIKERKRDQKKVKKLRDILVLVLRCLAILFLVLAFAEPYAHYAAAEKETSTIHVFIDNSASNYLDNKGLEKYKSTAIAFLENQEENQQIDLSCMDFKREGRSIDEAIQDINSMQVSLLSAPVNQKPDSNQRYYIFSDFQQNQWQNSPLLANAQLMLWPQVESNFSIDTAYVLPQKQALNEQRLIVKLSRTAAVNKQCVYSVTCNGKEIRNAILDFGAHNTLSDTLFVPSDSVNYSQIDIQIEDAEGLLFDNRYRMSLAPSTYKKVLIYSPNNEPNAFTKLLEKDNEYRAEVLVQGKDNFADKSYDNLLIVAGIKRMDANLLAEIDRLKSGGGLCLFFPSLQAEPSINDFAQSYGLLMQDHRTDKSHLEAFRFNHPYFTDVFDVIPEKPELPQIMESFALEGARSYEVLINGLYGALAVEKNNANFTMVFSGIPYTHQPNNNTFFKHALFVPFVLKALEKYESKNNAFELEGARLYANKLIQGQVDIVYENEILASLPWQKQFGKSFVDVENIPFQEGFYSLKNESGDAQFAINYSRSENNLVYLSEDDLVDAGAKIVEENAWKGGRSAGTEQWSLAYLFFALIFLCLLGESLAIKFLSYARKTV